MLAVMLSNTPTMSAHCPADGGSTTEPRDLSVMSIQRQMATVANKQIQSLPEATKAIRETTYQLNKRLWERREDR
jgi:hypothetical protein